ncbi:hypothetical protein ACS2QC_26650 [Bacillus cereus group sp. Bce033]|uniref:Uncharacterized protein n=1 Tax=Bacillus cereus (strain ATCC 10987 / NRS 248) TaxID=222523 RepID=Q74P59_BACC1|nr:MULTISPECIES: hypothetical protein [Bacillus]AAS44885.1 hypothetical protein BCE_A0035 [Bacillus cereus ATCC 10987]MDA2760704.1 hypothetical protein [Bacillus cereus group sp. Bc007]MCU5617763.1 hypothetical protein [Bacillus cereus]MCU9945780.1 hypothetical protein [Bacillus pacificus]MDA2139007.1 hypothetical protein [Bacillus cereus group sp. Bc256]
MYGSNIRIPEMVWETKVSMSSGGYVIAWKNHHAMLQALDRASA